MPFWLTPSPFQWGMSYFLSFDGAKVRRKFELRKRLRKIVCDNSLFIDTNQKSGRVKNVYYLIEKKSVSRGIVSIDRRVVISVISVINVVSRLYFKQRIVPYVATGMAMTMVLMLTTY